MSGPSGKGKEKGQASSTKCPCATGWSARECRKLQYAVRGKVDGNPKYTVGNETVAKIRKRLEKPEWKELRQELVKAGWTVDRDEGGNTRSQPRGEDDKSAHRQRSTPGR